MMSLAMKNLAKIFGCVAVLATFTAGAVRGETFYADNNNNTYNVTDPKFDKLEATGDNNRTVVETGATGLVSINMSGNNNNIQLHSNATKTIDVSGSNNWVDVQSEAQSVTSVTIRDSNVVRFFDNTTNNQITFTCSGDNPAVIMECGDSCRSNQNSFGDCKVYDNYNDWYWNNWWTHSWVWWAIGWSAIGLLILIIGGICICVFFCCIRPKNNRKAESFSQVPNTRVIVQEAPDQPAPVYINTAQPGQYGAVQVNGQPQGGQYLNQNGSTPMAIEGQHNASMYECDQTSFELSDSESEFEGRRFGGEHV
jgi:hypothetical protein